MASLLDGYDAVALAGGGASMRQGALSVTRLEIMPRPPEGESNAGNIFLPALARIVRAPRRAPHVGSIELVSP